MYKSLLSINKTYFGDYPPCVFFGSKTHLKYFVRFVHFFFSKKLFISEPYLQPSIFFSARELIRRKVKFSGGAK